MNYINPNAPAAGLTRLLNMRDNNPSTQLAYVPTKDIAAMGSMGGLEFNPYSGIPQTRGIAAVAEGGSINEAPLSPVADELASRGRYGDSMLLHVRPDELQGLASLGTLTINPDTGLPEAFSFKSLLPAVGAIAGSVLLGPAFAPIFGSAFGVGIGAGLGSFAGGLAAGQGVGQAALGGLMSGATAGFMQGVAPGLEAGATPGLDAAGQSASAAQLAAAEGVTSIGTPLTTVPLQPTAAGLGINPLASSATPVVNPEVLAISEGMGTSLLPADQVSLLKDANTFSNALTKMPSSSFPGETLASVYAPAAPPLPEVALPAAKFGPSVNATTGLQDTFRATEAYKPGTVSKLLGAEDIAKDQIFTRPEALDTGFIPSDIKISERAGQVLTDPKTYVGAGISTMLQPPPPMEYEEPEPLELGPSYVPRERTLAGGVQSPARSSEEYLRMALEGGYQPLSEQYRYAAQGGLVGLVEGGTPEQGVLQSQLSPVLQQQQQQIPLLQQQEQQISERARQDELLQRDQAMSRGQQFIEQPTGNQQMFQQMQSAGQVIGQQLAQGPQAYATPAGSKAPSTSFSTGADFGFNAGGLVGLAEGGEVGNSIAERRVAVRDYLKSKGLRDEAVAGIMGNIEAEAPSYKHDQIEKTEKKVKGYGLFQFTGPRKTAYFNWLEKNNQTDSAESQIDYVMDHINDTRGEMDKSEYDIGYDNRGTLRDAFKDGSVKDISKKFMLLFERPKDQSKEKIEFRQEQALNAFGRIPEPDKVSTPKAIVSAPPQVDRSSAPTTKDRYDDKPFSSIYSGMPDIQKETQIAKSSDTENDAGILSILRNILSGEDKQYEVQSGDTLSAIAKQQGMSLDELLEANKNISNSNVIRQGQEIAVPDQSSFLDRVRGALGYAQGGDIGQYFEGQVVGNGDGMSDQILFEVEGNNPDKALLSRDEYVIPADVVAMLGNGSSNAGSEQLDGFIKGIRQDSFGTQKQQQQLNAQQGLRGLV